MSKQPKISISKLSAPKKGTVVVLMHKDEPLPEVASSLEGADQVKAAMDVDGFKGAALSVLSVLAPKGELDRIILVGCGKKDEESEAHFMKIGGKIAATCKKNGAVTILAEDEKFAPSAIAAIASGIMLRSYEFDKYRTKKEDKDSDKEGAKDKPTEFTIACENEAEAKKQWEKFRGVSEGVMLARDLVNEPANILGTVEFAKEAEKLEKLGVEVEVLDEKALAKLKMGSLLGVAQGSRRPARLVIMKWNGGKVKDQPLAFVGKGVVFDTGGISLKPPAGMEDMKGDMGGAAAVTGLMHALAARKAKANVIGIIGLVENMPDGNAQRPGDIVTSMSGQTIEVINTDAEGRLVLADALWYCQDRFKPKFMVNLATLTGAILIALGNEHAGLFSNDDILSQNLLAAGQETDEKLWRMPLNKAYDKLIDSKNADMKNIGGRLAGSITAGQFLQRFVNDTPWAHLDIAGTAMNSPKNEYSQSWASGFGVRLLSRMVENAYE